jgi:hypothetical protein
MLNMSLTLLSSIESMKMETVIRSPQDGVIKKLAHKTGVSTTYAHFDLGMLTFVGHLQSWDDLGIIRGRRNKA